MYSLASLKRFRLGGPDTGVAVASRGQVSVGAAGSKTPVTTTTTLGVPDHGCEPGVAWLN